MRADFPELGDHLLAASGGLVWHLAALRYRNTLWRAFRENLEVWLEAWRPSSSRLLLVGPSAGWTLPAALPGRFAEVVALEPDPLARRLLGRRFSGIRFDRLDLFAPGGLDALHGLYSGYALLFCNVLGQLAPEQRSELWCERLRAALQRFDWASWHDLASSARPPDRRDRSPWPAGTSFDSALAGAWSGGEIEVRDHGTLALAAREGFETCSWSLRPGQHHLVAWTVHGADGGGISRPAGYSEMVGCQQMGDV